MPLHEGLDVPAGLHDLCDPTKTALLVYDMQVGICSQLADADRIVAQCRLAIDAARHAGMGVVYTRHLSAPRPWMGITQLRTAMAWQRTSNPAEVRPAFHRDAPTSALLPSLAPTADDLVVEKLAMSAFEGTPLAYAMRDRRLVGLAICGIALEIGIEPTVRHATDLGFIPILLADACGAGNAEAATRTIEGMRFMGEAVITDTAAFCGGLGG
jgi:biuret amidohydrolase